MEEWVRGKEIYSPTKGFFTSIYFTDKILLIEIANAISDYIFYFYAVVYLKNAVQ